MRGFEPLTPSLPWKCSTPELHWLNFYIQKLALPSCYSCQSNLGIRQTLLAVTGLIFIACYARHVFGISLKNIRRWPQKKKSFLRFIFSFSQEKTERATRLEPATLSLEGWCSTNWATPAYAYLFNASSTLNRRLDLKQQTALATFAALAESSAKLNCGGDRIRTYSDRVTRFTVWPGSPTPAHPQNAFQRQSTGKHLNVL